MKDFASQLSHCLDYNLTCGIKTAETANSHLLFGSQSSLSSLAKNEDEHVLTVFRAYNFDMKVGNQIGSNSTNGIHMMVFQKEHLACIIRRRIRISTERSKQQKKYNHLVLLGFRMFSGDPQMERWLSVGLVKENINYSPTWRVFLNAMLYFEVDLVVCDESLDQRCTVFL